MKSYSTIKEALKADLQDGEQIKINNVNYETVAKPKSHPVHNGRFFITKNGSVPVKQKGEDIICRTGVLISITNGEAVRILIDTFSGKEIKIPISPFDRGEALIYKGETFFTGPRSFDL